MNSSHQLMGMVTKVDLEAGHVRVKDDGEAFCTVCCGGETQIVGGEDPLALEGLQPGDYIRSECIAEEDGRLIARKIVLLRPAWRILESPEM